MFKQLRVAAMAACSILSCVSAPAIAQVAGCPSEPGAGVLLDFSSAANPGAFGDVLGGIEHTFEIDDSCTLDYLSVNIQWDSTANDADLTLLGPDGSELATSMETNAFSEFPGERVVVYDPQPGTYTIQVTTFLGAAYDYTGQAIGSISGSAAEPVSDPDRPRVVVSVIDSAFNPYHDHWYAGSSAYPDGAPDSVTQEVLQALGVDRAFEVTRTGDFAADVAADQAFWDSVQPNERIYYKGTNVVATSYAGDGVAPLFPTTEKSAHGTGTTASVINANPEAVILFIETTGNLGNTAAETLANTLPAVDVVNTSYGIAIAGLVGVVPSFGDDDVWFNGVVRNGKLHFTSAGNNPGFVPASDAGAWWSISVSGLEEDSTNGQQLSSGNLPDFVADFTQQLPYCMDCQDAIDSMVPGTSFSSPTAAGVASRVILEARKLLGHSGGIVDVAGTPTLATDGDKLITNWFVRRALEEAALPVSALDYLPQVGQFSSASVPINPLAPWLQEAWGLLSDNPDRQVVDAAITHMGLEFRTVRTKPSGYCEFQTEIMLLRKDYWASMAPELEDELDLDPFLWCESFNPLHPESNDPGGPAADGDYDGDGVADDSDNCPLVDNPDQEDTDQDGTGDACAQSQANNAPLADITGPDSAMVGQDVTFSAAASSDPDAGDSLSYSFDFGDGSAITTASTTATAVHSYAQAGDYTVQVTVSDAAGASDSATHDITITQATDSDGDGVVDSADNCPAIANGDQDDADNDGVGDACDLAVTLTADPQSSDIDSGEVTLSASVSNAGSGALSYHFYYGDGNSSGATSNASVSYAYPNAGTFSAHVVVIEGDNDNSASDGVTVERTTSVTVIDNPDAVVAHLSLTFEGDSYQVPVTVTLDASASTAPDGSSYCFDFGDGMLSADCDSSVVSHTYTTAGSYTARVTVTSSQDDSVSDVAQAAVTIVEADQTTAQLVVSPTSVNVGDTVTFDASSSFAASGEQIVSYNFVFGDGSSTGPQSESIVTHAYSSAGEFQPHVVVEDSQGTTQSATLKVNVSTATDSAQARVLSGAGAFGGLSMLPLIALALLRRRRRA